MVEIFVNKIKKAKKIAVIKDDRRIVHYFLDADEEMVEEYCLRTNIVVRRAWRRRQGIHANSDWVVELGEHDGKERHLHLEKMGIREDASQPFISRFNTKYNYEWRIRNLPYSKDVFSVSVNDEKQRIQIRTSNKKYYKELEVPELTRFHWTLQPENLDFSHKYNTLIITYKKPKHLLELENMILKEALSVKAEKHNDVNQCKQT